MRPQKAFGVHFEESEIMTRKNQFLTDGSGSFRSLDRALKYFDKLSNKLVRQENVDDLNPSDTELIPAYQLVRDNAS